MRREIITTESGKTMLSSNDRYYGARTLPVLYLHGGPGMPNLEVVDQMDYDGPVITYAQFGCGGSDKKESYTPELFVQQLREIVEKELNGSDYVLAGGSWGGSLALLYIDKYGTDNIRGLILSSPLIDSEDSNRINRERISRLPEDIREIIYEGNREKFFGESYCLAYRGFFRDYFGGKVSEHMADWCFEPSNDVYVQMWGKDESECTGYTKDLRLESVLKRISIPVLYISGDRDLHSVEDVRRYCSDNENIRLRIMEGTGHFSSSHKDYPKIVRDFIHSVDRGFIAAEQSNDFAEQEDLDMILSESPHDTPEHLRYAASKMTLEECAEEAERYENGDGRPQSYLSASIFYERCKSEEEAKWSVPYHFPFQRQYDAKDADRRLILAPGGIASFCCRDMKESYGGSSIMKEKACIHIRGKKDEFHACPFCGKDLEVIRYEDVERTVIGNDAEFFSLRDRYLNGPMTIREAVSLDEALKGYAYRRMNHGQYREKYQETWKKHESIMSERIRNITGKLTASSAGLESVCCEELSDNMQFSSWGRDFYYMRIRLNDSVKSMELKVCPYCGARLKRIPRTY